MRESPEELERLKTDARRYRLARRIGILSVPGWPIAPHTPEQWDRWLDNPISNFGGHAQEMEKGQLES